MKQQNLPLSELIKPKPKPKAPASELIKKRLVSQAFVEDIDFSRDEEAYKDALDFWDVVIDGKPSAKGKNYFTLFSKQYYKDYYGDRETYARYMSHFRTSSSFVV